MKDHHPDESKASVASPQSEQVLQSGEAWNGQPYPRYPDGKPQITVIRMSLPAHHTLPWHTHPVPNAAYLLAGSLTIEDKETGETHKITAG